MTATDIQPPDASAPAGHPAHRDWDVVVVGTGMGGATLGHALAKAGLRVLFCERGRARNAASLAGDYPEQRVADPADLQALQPQLAPGGRWPTRIADLTRPARERSFTPFIGSGAGGSSALYGMALERFFPSDFTPRASHPQAADAALVESWPVSWDEFQPHYAAAEQLYRVRGTRDPLRTGAAAVDAPLLPPPALTDGASSLEQALRRQGLHPYRLPQACEFVDGCRGCQSYLCDRACKNDSERICLTPALREHGATLLDDCTVLQLDADRTQVTGVVCERHGQRFTLRARTVVLAAGALQTPGLLLRSRNAHWPQGLANGSDQVGRNLMRHYVDLYVVRHEGQGPLDNRFKELAFNDFYQVDGMKLGSVQSFGRLPPVPMLLASMQLDLRNSAVPWLAPLLPLARPLLHGTLAGMVERSTVLATLAEDLPYADNRVWSGEDGGTRLSYRVRPQEMHRVRQLRRLMASALRGQRWRLVRQAHNNERIAHVCGTCRFGDDPRSSVLDRDNRAHGLDNLYVVDASFFPSSGGTNPGLTIAANALRVAQQLQQRL